MSFPIFAPLLQQGLGAFALPRLRYETDLRSSRKKVDREGSETPQDLTGVVVWLLSPSASFVTGIVVPVDGGFSAFRG